ncbi:hypothetical protein ACQ4PT_059138 [Festuca glaucescens]
MDKSKAATGAGLDAGAGAEHGALASMAAVVADPKAAKVAAVPVADQEAADALERRYKEIDAFDLAMLIYVGSEVTDQFAHYNTDDEVEEDNFESYVQRQYNKFQDGQLKITKRGKCFCTFCPYKVNQGNMNSLEMHAMDTRHYGKNMQSKGDHQALAKFLLGDRLPASGRPVSKRARRN